MKMTVVDLLNIYVKTGSAMSARVAGRLVGGFQGFFRIDPAVAYQHFRSKGIAFAKRRRYAQAADVLKQLRTERPEDAEIALYYGISLLKLSKREEGLLVLDDALVGYPDNIRIRALLALAFYQVQAWERALPLLAEAVAQDGADRDAWWRY
jgi:tetratricopeptide (TPR) repeat protein